MGNLIAIIFSIVLGAAATALTLVYLGSGFSDKSADIKAQQFLQAASQVESAMTVYRAEHAGTSYDTDYAGTLKKLHDENLVKEVPVAGQGVFSLLKESTDTWMLEKTDTTDAKNPKVVSKAVCVALVDKEANIQAVAPSAENLKKMTQRFGCFNESGVYTLAYKVE